MAEFALFGVAFFAFIIFTSSLSREFGWSGAETGSLVSALWIAAPLALFCGPLIERIGPWRLVISGLLIEVIAFIVLAFIDRYWELYLLRAFMGVGKVLIVSSLPIIVGQWFTRQFATATAIVWAGSPAGGLIVAPLTEILTVAVGWRTAAWICAGGLLAVTLLVGLIGRVGQPDPEVDGGDGDPADLPATSLHEFASPGTLTWSTVARSINWWAVAVTVASTVLFGLANIAVFSQQPRLLQASGVSATLAATMLGVTGGAAMLGSASIGMILDRFKQYWGGLTVGAAVATGVVCFILLQAEYHFLLALVGSLCLGFSAGAFDILWIMLTKRLFGVTLFPRTYSVWYFALQAGCAAGGGVGGWGLDHFGASGFMLMIAILYTPAIVFSIWQPYAGRPATS